MRTARSTERPAGALGSVLRWGERIALWAGIAAGAATGGAVLLWVVGREDKGLSVVTRSASAIVSLDGNRLHGPELAVFAGSAFVMAVPLAILAWRGPSAARRLTAAWAPAGVGAYLYATTVPGPRCDRASDGMFFPSCVGGQEIVWPLLGLGLMVAVLSAVALLQSLRQSRQQSWLRACLATAGAAAAGVAARFLIERGMVWTDDIFSLRL